MRISDWSSDVCSSDLNVGGHRGDLTARADQKANTIAAYGEGRLILAKGLTAIGGLQFTSGRRAVARSEEHTSELQSLMRISYAVFCLKKKTITECSITQISVITMKH